MRQQDVIISLPPKTNLTVIKKNSGYMYYIYNEFFFYKIVKTQPLFQFVDQNSRTLILRDFIENPFNTLFLKKLENFLFSWDNYFYEKIKFTGKGYRITFRKKKKLIIFFFGHSHDTIMVFRSLILKQPHKYKFLIIKNSLYKLKQLVSKITKIKPMNIYTKRGLRNSRQIIKKRKGKKSTFF